MRHEQPVQAVEARSDQELMHDPAVADQIKQLREERDDQGASTPRMPLRVVIKTRIATLM